jgi:tetratricopeptide (TPR) repeat protein
MGKNKNIPIKLLVLLGTAATLLIALVIQRSLLKHGSKPSVMVETPIVALPPSPDKKVVYLDKSSQWKIFFNVVPTQSILAKELVRQALLLSAREEAGFLTRDAWLGDSMPDDAPDETFNITATPGQPNKLSIELGQNANLKKIAELDLKTDADFYKDFLQKTEELSRGRFLTVLKNGGYVPVPKKAHSEAKVPPEIEKLLGEMNFISQYSAVRQLHELMREHGESPLLQGGLVRGYANLGLLTDYNWHPASKVFYARSMLYAQRMVIQGTHPSWAKWHRAYAFALAGLQKWAFRDLEDAEKESQSSSTAKEADNYAKPSWVDIISAFCRYDTKSLKPNWNRGENAELMGLLETVANELAMNGDLIVTKAMAMLEKTPECYRLYNVVCRFGGVIVGHPGTTVCFQVFREKSYRRLGKIPGMLEAVKRVIENGSPGQGTLSTLAAPYDEDPSSEFLMRRVLIAALFAAGRTAKTGQNIPEENAPIAVDRGEPSWATLGLLIRETSFVQVWRRIYFEANMLCVAPDDSLKEFKPLYADHPYGECLSIYSWDENVKNQTAEKVRAIQLDGVLLLSFPLFEQTARLDEGTAMNLFTSALSHMDFTSKDLSLGSICTRRLDISITSYINHYAHDIEKISPWSPYAGTLLIDNDWEYAGKDLKKWEELAASHPGLMQAIARRYLKDNRAGDAERCLKTAISLSPDRDSFKMLANLYYDAGDKKKYVATLKDTLNYPDYHLNHGKTCEQIANFYLEDQKWHKALPYAERAAETYSGWGLLCHANCCEAMRDWEQAEQLYKAVALRYQNSAYSWYCFCKRAGMGEVEEARKVALAYTDMKDRTDPFWKAVIFILEKQPEKALSTLQSSVYPWDKFLLFTMADQVNDYTTRDAAMQAILEMGKSDPNGKADLPPKEMIAMTKMIAADLTNKQSKIDLKIAETLIEKNEPTTQMMCYYYLGKYLDAHGREEDAIVFWKKCVGYWTPMDKFARTLAAAELRDHGVKQKDIEALLPTENTADEDETKGEPQQNQEKPQGQG